MVTSEAAAGAIDLDVVVVLKLQSEGGGLLLVVEKGLDLENDRSFLGRGFKGGEEVAGEGLGDGLVVQGKLTGKGTGVSGAPFENHFPDGIEAGFAAPGESPEVFFRDAFFGKTAVEVEVDDVEAALWENEEAIISPAPGGGVHAAARGVGADPEGHAVAVAANIGLGFAFVVSFEVEEFEAVLGAFGEDVGVGAFLSGWVGDAEEEASEVIALGSGKEVAFFTRVAHEGHGGRKGTIDEVAGRAFGFLEIGIWWSMAADLGAVVATIGVAGDAVPVERGGVTQSPERHRGAGHDLIAATDDGRF